VERTFVHYAANNGLEPFLQRFCVAANGN